MPLQEHIDAYQVLLLGFLGDRRMLMRDVCWTGGVFDYFEDLWLLTEAGNDGVGKLFRADFLLTDPLGIDVIGMKTIFERA